MPGISFSTFVGLQGAVIDQGEPGEFGAAQIFQEADNISVFRVNEVALHQVPLKSRGHLDLVRESRHRSESVNGLRRKALEAKDPQMVNAHPVLRSPQAHFLTVRELYTFGAPATSLKPLYDSMTPGGCFAGMRVATSSLNQIGARVVIQHDPVPSLLDFIYKHPLIDYASVSLDEDRPNNITTCAYFKENQARLKDTPKWDGLWWVDGHMDYPSITLAHADRFAGTPSVRVDPVDLPPLESTEEAVTGPYPGDGKYGRRLQGTLEFGSVSTQDFHNVPKPEKYQRTALMAELAFLNYLVSGQIGIGANIWGWTMVARANAVTGTGAAAGMLGRSKQGYTDFVSGSKAYDLMWTGDSYLDGFGDHLMLLQHPQTLDCVIVFEGSGLSDTEDWLSNLNFFSVNYCGFGQAHRGFRAKLYRMVGGIDYIQSVRQAAKHCATVAVAGHSLGGAQADLFAACANNPLKPGEDGYIDHRLTSLPKRKPRRLKPYHADRTAGVFIRNKGNNLCIDVIGTMVMEYRRRVIMYYCETPDSGYSLDQKWDFDTKGGQIVSRLSTKCVTAQAESATVDQQPCFPASSPNYTSQVWELTKEDFLRNKGSDLCLNPDMQLVRCPFTQQQFDLQENGLFVHRFSGKCLHVKAWGGARDGTELVLWPCLQVEGTYQHWELTQNKHLKNTLSGRCVVERLRVGSLQELQEPALVLGPCIEGEAIPFEINEGGFVMNTQTARCMAVRGENGLVTDGEKIDLALCEGKNHIVNGLWKYDPRGFLFSVGGGEHHIYKCLEIFGEPWQEEQKNKTGQRLWLDFCETNTDQKWEITGDGHIQTVIGGKKCLGFRRGESVTSDMVDTQLWIDDCDAVQESSLYLEMKWRRVKGRIVNRLSNKCMEYTPGNPFLQGTSGGPTVLPARWNSSSSSAGTLWSMHANGAIVSQLDGLCLDVGGPDFAKYPPLTTRPCTGTPGQNWTLGKAGLLKNQLKGLCAGSFLDDYDPEEMGLFLKPCPDSAHQEWDVLPGGQIRHKETSKCLDSPKEGETLKFYELTARECDLSRTEQKWEHIPAPLVSTLD